ncbi:hypothetical protein [Massilia sp. CFBP 13647]|uniref:hypothetical protein n=1 Tax=Massilia sp. CFBP 13647 TaxID=2775276 RepID=UPI00178580E2|nr:hypothetical protein [Massilia sp. CFBP 13647]MBD8530695.1 hypothetical protein [Massilia sp. CFBP 13647]
MKPVPSTPIMVALILAAAAVSVALISFFKTERNAGGTAGDTVIGSPGAQPGRTTDFQKQNSLFLQFVSASQRAGQHEIRFAIHNRADRFIGDAEVSAFDLSSATPVRLGEPARFSSGPGDFRSPPMRPGISLPGNPPEKLRLCLSFPTAEPGAFTTVLMDMRGELNQYKVLDYTMSADYVVFLSQARSDCNKTSLIKEIAAPEYAGGS